MPLRCVTARFQASKLSNYARITPAPVRLGTFLSKYGVDLTKLANEGKIQPVVGRLDELDRAVQILSKKSKNNPILIGEPGVGKTAIVEGLAYLIAQQSNTALNIATTSSSTAIKLPKVFHDKVIINLDLPSMLAGAKFRGEFEERLKGVLKDIELANDRVILYIDEIHNISGAGASEGAIDASNILKPALTKGYLRCIGTTTIEEYRKHIEKDAGLARRFQTIFVKEPTEVQAIAILQGIMKTYEAHHKIIISPSAIAAGVQLSHKYITDRKLPDKAIDLIDEAAAKLSIVSASTGGSLSIQEEGLDTGNSTSNSNNNSSMGAGENDNRGGNRYEEDTVTVNTMMRFSIPLEDSPVSPVVNPSSNNGNGNVKEAITPTTIPTPVSVPPSRSIYDDIHDTLHMPKEPITKLILTDEHIADIISASTGIPMKKLIQSEKDSLLNMETLLQKRIIGQDHAIHLISKCIRLSRAGLRYHDRPLGVFMLLGSTGVGKTELSKAITEFIFNDSTAMIRIDMSEYMEKHSVSRLIGAPPGYIGYSEGGLLTEAVKRRPYQVILLDEFEKAHKDVSNILLQVFDEGRLTDSHGNRIDFRNTIIILTSNLGSQTIYTALQQPNSSNSITTTATSTSTVTDPTLQDAESVHTVKQLQLVKQQYQSELGLRVVKSHFPPEFVNRLDEVVVFNMLGAAELFEICKIHISKLVTLLATVHSITCTIDNEDILLLSSNCYHNPALYQYGARPMKRFIEKEILDVFALLILENKISGTDIVQVTVRGEIYPGQVMHTHVLPTFTSTSATETTADNTVTTSTNGEHNNTKQTLTIWKLTSIP